MPELQKMKFDGLSSGINVLTPTAVLLKENFGEYYYKQRRLRAKYANTFLISLFGVSVVISGQYGSWNLGLKYGFMSMVISFLLATLMMWILACAVAELASLMPFTGGSSNFASLAFGPMAGAIEGYCFYSELLTFSSAVMMQISFWICETAGLNNSFQFLFWFLLLLFSSILLADIRAFLKVNAIYCIFAIVVIFIYAFAMIPFTSNFTTNIIGSKRDLFPDSGWGIFYSLPYSIWFFVGIEAIPFLSEETKAPTKSVPKALLVGMTILTILSLMILIVCPGSSPGIDAQDQQIYPLGYGVQFNFNIDPTSSLGIFVSFVFLSGNICSFLACLVGCHRSMYALSRAGLAPTILSLTIQKRGYGKGAPYIAILATSILIFVCASISFILGDHHGDFFILMCIAYSLISYTFTFCSFIRLRYLLDQLNRPYKSPFGIPGAVIGTCLSTLSLISVAFTNELRYVMIAMACQVILGAIYIFAIVRARVAYIPEKLFLQAQLKDARKENIVEERKGVSSAIGSGFSAGPSKSNQIRKISMFAPSIPPVIIEHANSIDGWIKQSGIYKCSDSYCFEFNTSCGKVVLGGDQNEMINDKDPIP